MAEDQTSSAGRLPDSMVISEEQTHEERGNYDGHVAGSSLYKQATMHPMLASLAGFTAVWGLISLWSAVRVTRRSRF